MEVVDSDVDVGIRHAYVHLPFCARRCPYCDFNAHAGREDDVEAYHEALLLEAESRLGDTPLETLYVGGGTPTYGEADRLRRTMSRLAKLAGGSVPEFTIEANPGTLDAAKVRALRRAGVNRVSLGAQSFDDDHLRTLGRIHDAAATSQSVRLLREGGLDRISLDLILALPHQTLAQQEADLARAVALEPEHVSAYMLTIEPGTPFHAMTADGRLPAPDDERELDHLHLAIAHLERAGYRRYEISNFAREGSVSGHNLAYWRDADWIGLGAGAHSHVGHHRWKNMDDPAEYARAIVACGAAEAWRETVAPRVRLFDALMMGLRLVEGVDLDAMALAYGIDPRVVHADAISAHVRTGLLAEDGARLRLTSRGLDLASHVLRDFVPDEGETRSTTAATTPA